MSQEAAALPGGGAWPEISRPQRRSQRVVRFLRTRHNTRHFITTLRGRWYLLLYREEENEGRKNHPDVDLLLLAPAAPPASPCLPARARARPGGESGAHSPSAVRLRPAGRRLGLQGAVEAGDVLGGVEAGGVVVLVRDDPGGGAGGGRGGEGHGAPVVGASYVQDLLPAEVREVKARGILLTLLHGQCRPGEGRQVSQCPPKALAQRQTLAPMYLLEMGNNQPKPVWLRG